jgi:hypothetical protein
MTIYFKSRCSNFFLAGLSSLAVTGFWFCLTWEYGFDLSDEGYYWYGAQRVLRGEVPIRDFYAYDAARYYWSAFVMQIMDDDGPFSARLSAAIFQFIGTFSGVNICLLALQDRGNIRWIFAVLVSVVLTIWVDPYYKVYDHATSILIVAMLVLMLKIAKPREWFLAGVCLGISAIFGRNHGVYGAAAVFFVVAVLLLKSTSRQSIFKLCVYFVLGVLIGFSPTFVMMLLIDGFASAFIDSIIMLFNSGATNIGLPVPWPWIGKWEWVGIFWTALKLATGIGFVFLVGMPVIGLLVLGYQRFDLSKDQNKVLFAAVAAAIPYAHYAFSRADLVHLSLGIFPALIAFLVVGASLGRLSSVLVALVVLASSLITLGNSQPYLSVHLFRNDFSHVDVGGEKLWVSDYVHQKLERATNALSQNPEGTNNFLALPDMPSLYAIYRTKMPIWEIYSLSPRDESFEIKEIKLLEASKPNIVLLSDHALDNNPDFRYSRMHPIIYSWIISHYRIVNNEDGLDYIDFQVYSPKMLN